MVDGYDAHLFIEIIQTEGINPLPPSIIREGVIIEYFEGKNGKRVAIITSDEFITNTICKGYLHQLGLSELIPILFP